jgi:hypothetical protein
MASVDKPTDPGSRVVQHRQLLNRRLRATFIEGAEQRSREAHGRGLSDEELRKVVRRYPGDLPER